MSDLPVASCGAINANDPDAKAKIPSAKKMQERSLGKHIWQLSSSRSGVTHKQKLRWGDASVDCGHWNTTCTMVTSWHYMAYSC